MCMFMVSTFNETLADTGVAGPTGGMALVKTRSWVNIHVI
ncbi:hypothetical protein KPSA3_05087 [Pseudomonas syringae pv. actinidiae]|uniref:Uncharacterized protein n=2 Tax=Pseudomonas syringae pv. actinidiae TaxID=103796 RepID=A0AAN4QBC6_PSESF|nr:hypothetical protein KPSA3_05087 [Pseudomonas syringae pv. actinidiae]